MKKKAPATLPRLAIIRTSFLISDVGRLHRVTLDRKTEKLGLTRSEWWLIAYLVFVEGSTQQQIADVMEIGRSGIAKLIDRLEKKKLIERSGNADDARVKHVYLSAQAKPLARQIKRRLLDTATQSTRKLSAAQLATLEQCLTIIEETLLEDLAQPPPYPIKLR